MGRELAVATEIAREAGALLVDYLQRPLHIAQKGRRADIVTDADRASEELIVARLRAEFPGSSIVGEESGAHAGNSNDCWYVDPLDGTTNYAHGYPMYCVSIGLVRAGEPVCGVVFAPHFGELFAAEKGAGAQLNGQPVRVSTIDAVADALTCTGFHPADFNRNGTYFATMSRTRRPCAGTGPRHSTSRLWPPGGLTASGSSIFIRGTSQQGRLLFAKPEAK